MDSDPCKFVPFHQVTLDELGTGFAAAVSLVLVNRLMISVRRYYYGSVRNATEVVVPTLQLGVGQSGIAVTAPATGTTTTADAEAVSTTIHPVEEYELQEYSEKAGF